VRSTREAVTAAAGKARFWAYWLAAPLGVRLARVARRSGDASDADIKIASDQTEPADIRSPWRRLDASRPIAAIVEDIMNDIAPTKSLPVR
jgi:predicted kinase